MGRYTYHMISGGTSVSTTAPTASASIDRFGYLPQIDGLRAVGILLVLIHHGLQPLEFGGYVGVDIFFVLSGYLITSILLKEWANQGTIKFRNFYIRRAIRLYPSLLLALVILLPFGYVLWGWKHLIEVALAATYTTPLVVEIFGMGSKVWLHTWSLGIEEMFYLIWPLATVGLLKTGLSRPWLHVGILGAVMLVAQIALVSAGGEASYFLRAGAMFLGCALALWMNKAPRYVASAWVASAWGIVLLAGVGVGTIHGFSAVAFAVTAAGTLGVLAGVTTRRNAVVQLLSARPLVYLGKISYELYIWHYAVLVLLWLAAGSSLLEVAWIGIPLSLALAVFTHYLFSSRIARWKNRFPY